ncbi:MAG: 50S ribosomal protein L2 [Candidatus Magasanikbacteria bacterium]|nr:50S ribosomal protein L2 [Candidatus Magasanikbacteria bacterium]MCA9391043.1 50S ribosomal protein L2 [Candidatus Magasanikbacteria bacterium]USN52593.1 MAG: 50S ribosomal protein L2 [Candidatus Nomurabacteria bacterium]
MPIKKIRPVTIGQRNISVQDFSDITASKPEKSLIISRKNKAGRNGGKIAVRHQGGGHKKFIREVDFTRSRYDIPATVKTIEYDPNRGARISLVAYKDGVKSYVLTPDGLQVGMTIVSSLTEAEILPGNRLPLSKIPVGTTVHSVELAPGKGGQLGHGAGSRIEFMAVEDDWAVIKLPSGETRRIPKGCMATIGSVSNQDWHLVRWGKAGRMRHRGIRPTVRGKVMNPVDHPHGGGEGKHPIGMKYAKTKWGKHALGVKTRRRHLASDKFIIRRRKGNTL